MLKFLGIAWRSLVQHRRRNLALGAAIAIVTALLVLLSSLSAGMKYTMLEAATTLASGHVNVAGFYKITSGNPAPVVTGYPELKALIERATPEAEQVIDRTRGWAKIVSVQGSVQSGLAGIDVTREAGLTHILKLAEEREYKEGGTSAVRGSFEDLARPNTILLFAAQAKRLEVEVGDQVTLSAPTLRGVNNTADVDVVAIAKDMGLMSNWSAFVPHQVVRDIYKMADTATGAIQVYLKDPALTDEVEARLRKVVVDAGYRLMEPEGKPFFMKFERVQREDWTGQKIDITDWEDEISYMSWTLTTVDGLSGLLITILMVLIMVGIMNTLWIAIRERTKEIGTLRAIGMGRRQVLAMFLAEAMMLGALSAGIGAAIGVAVCLGLDAAQVPVESQAFRIFTLSDTLQLRVEPASLAQSVLFIAALTTLAALYPAYRATRLKPISAIHHIG